MDDRRSEEDALSLLPLDELLARAHDADPSDRYQRYRRSIEAHGVESIVALREWLLDVRLRSFAAVVIGNIGKRGGKAAAVEALTWARDNAPDSTRDFLAEQLKRVGAEPVVLPIYAPGTQITPIGGGAGVHHIVADTITSSVTSSLGDLVLVECHFCWSGEWLREQGGYPSRPTGPRCIRCDEAVARQVV